jgi:hypothetical protein
VKDAQQESVQVCRIIRWSVSVRCRLPIRVNGCAAPLSFSRILACRILCHTRLLALIPPQQISQLPIVDVCSLGHGIEAKSKRERKSSARNKASVWSFPVGGNSTTLLNSSLEPATRRCWLRAQWRRSVTASMATIAVQPLTYQSGSASFYVRFLSSRRSGPSWVDMVRRFALEIYSSMIIS